MAKFAHLNPDSNIRTQYWNEQLPAIRGLLQELNEDVFHGTGKIQENGFYLRGLYIKSNPPKIYSPHLRLNLEPRYWSEICIFVPIDSTPKLDVIVELGRSPDDTTRWQWFYFGSIEKKLADAAAFVLTQA